MAIFSKRRKKSKGAAKATDENGLPGFSPNPMTNLILTDIALRGVSRVARRVTEQKLLSKRYKKVMSGRSVGETLLAAAVARTATRSLPGAVIIGGGLLAKTLYDRKRGRSAKIEGRRALHKRIAEAED